MRRFFLSLIAALAAVFLPVFPGIAGADTLGQTQSFFVDPTYDASGANTITATLRASGTHGYFYIDDRYWNSLSADDRSRYSTSLVDLASQFDSTTYPRETAFFGSENTPGVDGDPHVVVLLEQLAAGNGGYFQTINNYTKDRAPNSNAREMIFVNALSVSATTAKSYTAHEFQHLISFNQKELLRNVQDDLWLNEGRSEYAVTVAGYDDPFEGSTLQRRTQTFVRTPSDSLVDWPNTSVDYAITTVFLHYLADRYGQDIIASTEHTTAAGVAAIDEWLMRNGKTERFGDVFSDWMVASYLNDRSIDPRYGYSRAGMDQIHVSPDFGTRLDSMRRRSDFSASLKEWQPMWVQNEVSDTGGTENVTVRISGNPYDAWYGAAVSRYHDGSSGVIWFVSTSGVADITVPGQSNGSDISSVTVAVSQGTDLPVGNRVIDSKPVTVTMSLGDITGPIITPTPVQPSGLPINGDLIRRTGQSAIYVVWGPYRRYLPDGVLKLYGFENRPVRDVGDDIFLRYQTSNYVREVDQKKVYALWPDGSKHWLNITAAQWDATGRDWGAIFTVNASEINWYTTGVDITR